MHNCLKEVLVYCVPLTAALKSDDGKYELMLTSRMAADQNQRFKIEVQWLVDADRVEGKPDPWEVTGYVFVGPGEQTRVQAGMAIMLDEATNQIPSLQLIPKSAGKGRLTIWQRTYRKNEDGEWVGQDMISPPRDYDLQISQ